MTTTKNASPTKLPSGAWGARVQGEVALGETVKITTRAGKSWNAQVTQIVSSRDGVTICVTAGIDRPSPSIGRRGRCRCADSSCCSYRCNCDSHCVCQGGPIHDC